jgi:hypothetical protein
MCATGDEIRPHPSDLASRWGEANAEPAFNQGSTEGGRYAESAERPERLKQWSRPELGFGRRRSGLSRFGLDGAAQVPCSGFGQAMIDNMQWPARRDSNSRPFRASSRLGSLVRSRFLSGLQLGTHHQPVQITLRDDGSLRIKG